MKDISILFVEDDELTRTILGKQLEEAFAVVHKAADGAEGLEMYREKAPDIVVTDLTMPVMTGTEMLMHIYSINPEQPVVVLTGFSEDSEFLSDVTILHKPVIAADVISIINDLIEA